MVIRRAILDRLGGFRRTKEKRPEIDARQGRKSSDKEDILAADRFGMRGLDFEDSQRKPRH